MAVAAGFSQESDKDWYHGELTRDEAEQALKASGCDCFLIRQSHGVLFLSLIHDEEFHHITIACGPGWYDLENGLAQYNFTELEDLVAYYRRDHISDGLQLTLGLPCEKTKESPGYSYSATQNSSPHCNTVSDSTKEMPPEFTDHYWFYGNITEEQATAELSLGNSNTFLVRHTSDTLMLSSRISGWRHDKIIHRGPEGFWLEGKEQQFKSITELIAHYQKFPIDEEDQQVLGNPCDRRSSVNLKVAELRDSAAISAMIFEKKKNQLHLTWKRKADLPTVTSSPQIVKASNCVFVGGGFRIKDTSSAIFRYSINDDIWTTVPQCPTFHQSLATLNGELISVGGVVSQGVTNTVYTLRDGEWKEVLPPMPTPRCLLSTVSHNDELIVAAGGRTGTARDGKALRTRAVEIYTRDRQWYVTKPLPIPISVLSTCVIGSVCYMLGGVGEKIEDSRTTLCVSLPTLVEEAVPASGLSFTPETTEEWSLFPAKHPLLYSSIVELDRKLVAMGGSYEEVLRQGTRFISSYDFVADMWVECQGAQLPVPLYRPGVVKLAGNKVMVIGGQPKMQQFSNEVYIGSYELKTHYCTTQLC